MYITFFLNMTEIVTKYWYIFNACSKNMCYIIHKLYKNSSKVIYYHALWPQMFPSGIKYYFANKSMQDYLMHCISHRFLQGKNKCCNCRIYHCKKNVDTDAHFLIGYATLLLEKFQNLPKNNTSNVHFFSVFKMVCAFFFHFF